MGKHKPSIFVMHSSCLHIYHILVFHKSLVTSLTDISLNTYKNNTTIPDLISQRKARKKIIRNRRKKILLHYLIKIF